MTKTIRHFGQFLPVALAAALGAATAQPGHAASDYDGTWSVTIVAEDGNCPSRTVAINVVDGRVSYSGLFGAEANGAIGAGGALKVSFSHKDERVTAKGALKGRRGFGSWASRTRSCGGSWTARRA